MASRPSSLMDDEIIQSAHLRLSRGRTLFLVAALGVNSEAQQSPAVAEMPGMTMMTMIPDPLGVSMDRLGSGTT